MPITPLPLSRKPERQGIPASWPKHLGGQLWPADAGPDDPQATGGTGPRSPQTITSGHPELDAALTGGGWPSHALMEALQPRGLHAEWRLMLPAVQALQSRGAHVLLISPPFMPYLPGLARLGLDPDRIAWVKAGSSREIWWALEQSLRCQARTAVLAWCSDPDPAATRRLQLAATRHDGLCCLFRPAGVAAQASAAALRLQLRVGGLPGAVQARLLKQRGRAASDWLPLGAAWAWQPGWKGLLTPAPVPVPVPVPVQVQVQVSEPASPPTPPGALDALLDRLAHS